MVYHQLVITIECQSQNNELSYQTNVRQEGLVLYFIFGYLKPEVEDLLIDQHIRASENKSNSSPFDSCRPIDEEGRGQVGRFISWVGGISSAMKPARALAFITTLREYRRPNSSSSIIHFNSLLDTMGWTKSTEVADL